MKKTLLISSITALMIGCGGGGSGETTSTTEKNIISQNIDTKKVETKRSIKTTTIDTQAPARDVAMSKDALFVAEGGNGVEIIKIGYSDTISSELIGKIKVKDAKNVSLSDDEKRLFVEKQNGKITIVDIRDLSKPKIVGEKPKLKLDIDVKNSDNTYKYVPKGKGGLEVWSIANPASPTKEATMKSSNCFDIVLIDDDKKALIATGAVGIKLLKLDNPKAPNPVSTYRITGSKVTGLSLSPSDDILFVATGDKGVMVFNLDILLHKMGD